MEHIFNNADKETKIIVREIKKNISDVDNIIKSKKNISYMDKIKNHSIPNFNWFSIYLLKNF